MKIEKDRVVRFHYTRFEGGAPAPDDLGNPPYSARTRRAPL